MALPERHNHSVATSLPFLLGALSCFTGGLPGWLPTRADDIAVLYWKGSMAGEIGPITEKQSVPQSVTAACNVKCGVVVAGDAHSKKIMT
ncbi:hypothetical protein NQZ79_g6139 [Umbelopsis isabellina]|nr:hypothetical protein NQZ79_g6139 [Umbelopsis isabellina]